MRVTPYMKPAVYNAEADITNEYNLFFETIKKIDRWAKLPSNNVKRKQYGDKLVMCGITGDPVNQIVLQFMHEVSGHWFNTIFENVDCLLLATDALLGTIDKKRVNKIRRSYFGFCEQCGEYGALQIDHTIAVDVVGNSLGKANEGHLCPKCNREKSVRTTKLDVSKYITFYRTRC